MKHFFTLFLLLPTLAVNAQVKGSLGDFDHMNSNSKVSKSLLPIDQLNETTSSENTTLNGFEALPLFSNQGKEEIKYIYKDAKNRPIAVQAKVNYDQRNLSSTQDRVEAFLDMVQDVFLIENVEENFKILKEEIDELRIHHVKLQQYYKGLEIFGGESILHGQNGAYDFLNGKIYNQIDLEINPSQTIEASFELVEKHAGPVYKNDNDPMGIFEGHEKQSKLIVYPYKGQYHLVYHHSFYTDLIHRWEYFVDANSGEIINHYQSICQFHNHESTGSFPVCEHSNDHHEHFAEVEEGVLGEEKANAVDLLGISREIDTYSVGSNYYMIDASRDMFSASASNMPNEPVGTIWTIDAFNTSPEKNDFNYDHVTSFNNTWNDRGSVSAQFNGAKAFLYFKNVHQRNSINGSGGNIIGLVNVADENGQSLGNAFWNGAAMFYGSGDNSFNHLAAGLDVAGHEMTHGVIQNTANLTYQDESGALNESFADVFGTMIDRDDWLIGEDVVKSSAFPSGALRSMSNPHNGASTGDFGSGWQPKKYSERYQGTQDNGGVHINSGIPNHAFYLFANDARLGNTENARKLVAEKVYYRALTQYLTKSSDFVDCRVAVVKAASDLYGSNVVDAARSAFDAVEIFGEDEGSYQNDVNSNPGNDLVLLTWPKYDGSGNPFNDNLYVYDVGSGQYIFNPLSESNPVSKPSVTDDGSRIVFVDENYDIREILIDWSSSTPTATENIISNGSDMWVNAITSKDGRLVAALDFNRDNLIWVFDRVGGTVRSFELKNPTYTGGISTGDVLFADAMEFDYSGEYIIYDANNRINSTSSGSIDFFDIGFIKVWEKDNNSLETPDQIGKLFQGLPEGISIGNPALAKNSNYIIAFDVWVDDNNNGQIDVNDDFSVWGLNIETGDNFQISENNWLGYPSYSRTDEVLIFDELTSDSKDLQYIFLNDNKITANGSAEEFIVEAGFGVWFSNGLRQFTATNDEVIETLHARIIPNPSQDDFQFEVIASKSQSTTMFIYGNNGQLIQKQDYSLQSGQNNVTIEGQELASGVYYGTTMIDDKIVTLKMIKI